MARLSCDPSRLRPRSEIDLPKLLNPAAYAAEWQEASVALDSVGLLDLPGAVNPGDRLAFYWLLRSLGVRRLLEVGTHVGASTAVAMLALRRNAAEAGQPVHLCTVDILDVNDPAASQWLQYGARYAPCEVARRLGCEEFVEFVAEGSVPFLARESGPWDLVFLDGDHAARMVYQEVCGAVRRLADGGVVLLHDYFPGGRPLWPEGGTLPGPWRGLERLQSEGAAVSVLPLGELPWPTKQGSHLTSLALVLRGSGSA